MNLNLKHIFILLILIVFTSSYTQIEFEKTKHDFGDITNLSDRYIDLRLTNKSQKKQYILSVKKPQNIV